MKAFRLTTLLLVGCAALLGSYSVAIEPFRLRIVEHVVTTPKLEPSTTLRLLLVADPHMDWPWMTPERLGGIALTANDLRPDVILLLGDYVGTHRFKKPVSPEDGMAALKQFKAPCGVYAVLGNHDFDSRAPGWDTAMRKSGLVVLEDTSVRLECRNHVFSLVGLKDQVKQSPDLQKALSGAGADLPVILMMHEPDLFPAVPDTVALTVAGHTHGGQISLPFIGPIVVPSIYGTRYAHGHIKEDGKDLVVSGGLGLSIVPIRFGVIPELTVVTLLSP